MSNPLYDRVMANRPPVQNGNMLTNFLNFANQFRAQSTMTPQQKVQQMLDSGQMTQEQFNELRQMANRLTGKNY